MVAAPQATADKVVQLAREGLPIPQEAITWALEVSGDIPGEGMATAELWSFLSSLERAYR